MIKSCEKYGDSRSKSRFRQPGYSESKLVDSDKKYDAEIFGDILAKRRSNALLTYVDESDLEPIIIDANAPLKFDLYQMDHNYDFISQQPLCYEVWLDELSNYHQLNAFEPYHQPLLHPEFGYMLR